MSIEEFEGVVDATGLAQQKSEGPQPATVQGWFNSVTWKSKNQSVVACSSAEAKFRALAQGVCVVVA